MKVVAKHSHLNGLEFMLVQAPLLWEEIVDFIAEVNAEPGCDHATARPDTGNFLHMQTALMTAFERVFKDNSWESQTRTSISLLDAVSVNGYTPSFMKDRVAVSLHLTDSFERNLEIHARHLAMFKRDQIDVGIEIVPSRELHGAMSSGVPYYEGELYNLIREGRGVPGVPLVLVGIEQ